MKIEPIKATLFITPHQLKQLAGMKVIDGRDAYDAAVAELIAGFTEGTIKGVDKFTDDIISRGKTTEDSLKFTLRGLAYEVSNLLTGVKDPRVLSLQDVILKNLNRLVEEADSDSVAKDLQKKLRAILTDKDVQFARSEAVRCDFGTGNKLDKNGIEMEMFGLFNSETLLGATVQEAIKKQGITLWP